MLKKRILAIQAAVVLGVSTLAATTIPVGNIATVEAALTKQTGTALTYDEVAPDWGYGFDVGSAEVKSGTQVQTGDTIKFYMEGAQEPAKNFKKQITAVKDGKTIYGERTINEKTNLTETPFFISTLYKYNEETKVYESVDKADFAKYVTVNSDGTAKIIGTGKFYFDFEKFYNGTVTREVTDVYEDGTTEKDTLSSAGIVQYWDSEKGVYVDGFRRVYYDYVYVNQTNAGTKTFRNADYYDNKYPATTWLDTDGVSGTIIIGETAVITVEPYEPINESNVIWYSQYDAATDTYKNIMGTQTIVETVTGGSTTNVTWTLADGDKDYASVSGGVVKGLKATATKTPDPFVTVTPSVTFTRSFTITNKWEDGITETYKANEGTNDGKETAETVTIPGNSYKFWIVAPEDSGRIDYKKYRLNDANDAFGHFADKSVDEVVVGKGESKDVAGSWGAYVPKDNSNDPEDLSGFTYYDANGKKQKMTGTETVVEKNVSIKHEYSSTDEKIVTVDKETGKITGVAPGIASIEDTATIRSTFTYTWKWGSKAAQTVTTGEKLTTRTNAIKVRVVDAAAGIANGGTYKDATSKAEYIVYTKTKTASYKKPTNKSAKKYTVPVKIKVNGEEYTVNAIEDKAFSGLKKAQVITVNAPIKYMGEGVFSNTPKLTEVVMKAAKIDRITEGTFAKAKKFKKLTVNGNALNYIDEGAFDKNAKITVTVISKKKSAKKAVAAMFKDAGYTKVTIKWKKK